MSVPLFRGDFIGYESTADLSTRAAEAEPVEGQPLHPGSG